MEKEALTHKKREHITERALTWGPNLDKKLEFFA